MTAQSLFEHAGLALTDVRFTVRDISTAYALVREGMGVSLVLESNPPEDMRNLRALPLAPAVYREFGLVRSQAGQKSRAVSALWSTIDTIVGSTTNASTQPARPSVAKRSSRRLG
jgi:DNA-binding transcriptional LysR family regulator